MEFIDGESALATLEKRGPFDEQDAIEIGIQVGLVLEHASSRGIVHRDIKPENILITKSGVVKVADFGIAREIDSSVTIAGMALGTPHYMSPEQILGDHEKVDVRSDIYSLGASLFHLVIGEPPFVGDTAASVITRHLREESPDPRQKNPKVSESFARVIKRMLEKSPEDRYRKAKDLLKDLENLAAGNLVPLPGLPPILEEEPQNESEAQAFDVPTRGTWPKFSLTDEAASEPSKPEAKTRHAAQSDASSSKAETKLILQSETEIYSRPLSTITTAIVRRPKLISSGVAAGLVLTIGLCGMNGNLGGGPQISHDPSRLVLEVETISRTKRAEDKVTSKLPAGEFTPEEPTQTDHASRDPRPASRILIVQGEPTKSRMMARHLCRKGYEVSTASDSAAAIKALDVDSPELLVVEYRLPGGVTALDLYGQVKELGHDLPIVIVTDGAPEDGAVTASLRAGAGDFVSGPELWDYLPHAIKRALSAHSKKMDAVHRTAQLRALGEIARTISEGRNPSRVLEVGVHAINQAVPSNRLAVYSYDPAAKALTLNALKEISPFDKLERSQQGRPIRVAGTRFEECITQGRTIYNSDLTQHQQTYPEETAMVENGVFSNLMVPIRSCGEIIGLLAICRSSRDAFTEDERTFLKDAAVHLGLAINTTFGSVHVRREFTDSHSSPFYFLPNQLH